MMRRWRVTSEHTDGRKDDRIVQAETVTDALAAAAIERLWRCDQAVHAVIVDKEWAAALLKADELITDMLRSGDPELMDAARRDDGRVDVMKLANAGLAAREKIAMKILMGEI